MKKYLNIERSSRLMKKIYVMLILSVLWAVQVSNSSAGQTLGQGAFEIASDSRSGETGVKYPSSFGMDSIREHRPDNGGLFMAVLDTGFKADMADNDMQFSARLRGKGTLDGEGALLRFAKAEKNEGFPEEEVSESIADPLEPLNRAFFLFNDKFYFWLLKPAATGYKAITPQAFRVGIKNFFYNIAFPIRFVNCLLQGKLQGAGIELTRFALNTTLGVAGFLDLATSKLDLQRYEEDFGQTLGFYGLGTGFYINWPVLGPSSARGTFGLAGDYFLDPVNLVDSTSSRYGIHAGDRFNRTSLQLGDYEDLKKSAIDPYAAVRDAYYQYRKKKIEE